jgi:hypothetical protein
MNNYYKIWRGYKIYISDKPSKKYYAIVDNKKVYFGKGTNPSALARCGQMPYEHYYDILGYYQNKNHLDKLRRSSYYARHGKTAEIGTAKYFSHNILWPLHI